MLLQACQQVHSNRFGGVPRRRPALSGAASVCSYVLPLSSSCTRVQFPSHPCHTGKLHFVNFETSRVEDAIDFIEAKGLHRHCSRNGTKEMRVKATGG